MEFKPYASEDITECRPYEEGENLDGVTISGLDRQFGHPKAGDMIARMPKNPDYLWLIPGDYFTAYYKRAG
jgi:hypothetical protein